MPTPRNSAGVFFSLTLILILLLIESCASIGNPSGGPRDERPPRFVNANPAPGSAEIPLNKERFSLTFDELVEVKDVTSKVIVSPPTKSVPRIAAQGRHVYINFRDSLAPNTTYTINFSNSIQDINEGNPLNQFSHTFSTGPIVDTLRIAGRVLSAEAMEPMQYKLVGVHRLDNNGESLPADSISATPLNINQSLHNPLFTKKFDFVGRTDDRGQFSIEGLPAGQYRIYALDDINSDYLFSNSDEEVAFLDAVISPSTSFTTTRDSIYNMKLGVLDTVMERRRTLYLPNDLILRSGKSRRAQQYIERYERVDSTRINFIFHTHNADVPEMSVVGMPENSKPWITERSATNDTISLWLNSPGLIANDTLFFAVKYQYLDSLQQYQTKSDTLRFTTDRTALIRAQEKARKEREKREKQEAKRKDKSSETDKEQKKDTIPSTRTWLKIEFLNGASQPINRPVRILTSVPPIKIDTAGINLQMKVDTVWKKIPLPPLLRDSLNPRLLSLGNKWDPGKEYKLTIDSLAITGLYGLENRKEEHSFSIKEDKQFCSLTFRLSDWPAGRPAFVELLNQSDKPVASAKVTGNVAVFQYLNPGKYYARIVDDCNANMKTDPGDPLLSLQPEAVYYYPKSINIKQNWNKDETWAVFATPVDKMKPQELMKNKPATPKGMAGRKTTKTQSTDEDDE